MTARPHPTGHPHPESRRAPRGRRASLLRRVAVAGVATAAALAGTVLAGASPAAAGGPTSVLIVNYDGARASGALTGSTAYDDLASALDVFNTPVGESRPAESFMSSQVRLTWMIHDVTPWRIDAIYLDGATVWVSTAVSQDGRELFNVPAVWHQPKDPDMLLNTLTSMGVLGSAPADVSSPSRAGSAGQTPTQAAPASASARPAAASGPAWWLTAAIAVAALGLGLLLGRTGRRAVAQGDASVTAGAPSGDAGMPPGAPSAPGAWGARGVRDPTGTPGAAGPGQLDDASRPSPVGFSADDPPGRG